MLEDLWQGCPVAARLHQRAAPTVSALMKKCFKSWAPSRNVWRLVWFRQGRARSLCCALTNDDDSGELEELFRFSHHHTVRLDVYITAILIARMCFVGYIGWLQDSRREHG